MLPAQIRLDLRVAWCQIESNISQQRVKEPKGQLIKPMKTPSPQPIIARAFARVGLAATSFGMLLCLPVSATVLDNFNGAKTGWTDTLNGGTVVQSGGQFTVTTATGSGA